MRSDKPTTREMHDRIDHLLWSLLVRGESAWRLRGMLLEYVSILEYLEHHDEIVQEIRRKRRWDATGEV